MSSTPPEVSLGEGDGPGDAVEVGATDPEDVGSGEAVDVGATVPVPVPVAVGLGGCPWAR
jgi:hypothetical protein